jgi:hypothetical protein
MDKQIMRLDIKTTLCNRDALFRKKNLLYWYKRLYERILGNEKVVSDLRILEVVAVHLH